MIFDAGPGNSPVLLQLGNPLTAGLTSPADPSLVQDVFFRIGGATAGSATDSPARGPATSSAIPDGGVTPIRQAPAAVAARAAGQWAIWSARCGSFQPGRTKWQVYPPG